MKAPSCGSLGLQLKLRGLGVRSSFGFQSRRLHNIRSEARTQRAQYPLIKEYSLNHNMKPYII